MNDFSPDAARLARGLARSLDQQGWRTLAEFPLASGRRCDLIALDDAGRFLIVEIKTSAADFRADHKWQDYLEWCDSFSFAVPESFPLALLPPEAGLIIADGFEAVTHRPPMAVPPLAPARRRQLLIRFGRASADRLRRALDPEP